eukprot:1463009-Pleurochrysis_carterae.AAC.3
MNRQWVRVRLWLQARCRQRRHGLRWSVPTSPWSNGHAAPARACASLREGAAARSRPRCFLLVEAALVLLCAHQHVPLQRRSSDPCRSARPRLRTFPQLQRTAGNRSAACRRGLRAGVADPTLARRGALRAKTRRRRRVTAGHAPRRRAGFGHS